MVDQKLFNRLLILNLFTSAHCMVAQLALLMAISYIFSNSVLVFSFFSGLYLMSMGLGSLLVESLRLDSCRYVSLVFWNSVAGIVLANPGVFGIIVLNEYIRMMLHVYGSDLSFLLFPSGIVLTCLIGVVSGAELPIFSKITEMENWHVSMPMIGVLRNDYLGAFVGVVVFTFILNPFSGLISSILISQMICLACINVVYFFSVGCWTQKKFCVALICLDLYVLILYNCRLSLLHFIDRGCIF